MIICIVTAVTSGYELNQMPGRGALWGQDDHLLPRASRGQTSINTLSAEPEPASEKWKCEVKMPSQRQRERTREMGTNVLLLQQNPLIVMDLAYCIIGMIINLAHLQRMRLRRTSRWRTTPWRARKWTWSPSWRDFRRNSRNCRQTQSPNWP